MKVHSAIIARKIAIQVTLLIKMMHPKSKRIARFKTNS